MVYFDVEGLPERNVFYLIGAVVVNDGIVTPHQFWADTDAEQEDMWRHFLGLLAGFDDYRLVHFGRYERDFLREMQRRYDAGQDCGQLHSRLFDVHAAIRTNVFFPVYSNGLKEIGQCVGAAWQGPVRCGIDSIVWRYNWEKTNDERSKDDLIRYNHEDCLAVRSVLDQLRLLSQGDDGDTTLCADTDGLPDTAGGGFGKSTFALPALKTITRCAYFNYQQEKVFFRTDKNVRRSIRRKRRSSSARQKVNTIIDCPPPDKCPRCGASDIIPLSCPRETKTVRDARFFRGGVKRWVVRFETGRYVCRSCHRTCYSPRYPTGQPLFGHSVASWAIHQHVALQQSFVAASESINDILGYSFGNTVAQRAHRHMARRYEATADLLVSRLHVGNMICADEAKIGIKGGVTGYVWVFSGPEVVIYRFGQSRDATVLNEVLGDFKGVLVSDFYGVYDSVKCQQQKCLVHLVRDINDDLLKAPFDEELKDLASRFTALMTRIIEAVDRYGLTKRHLGKFIMDTTKYRKWVGSQSFTSRAAQRYQERIGKFGERLFTFLSHDGVPWNNNLAENAVKLIASRRRVMDGLMSKDGIKDYLIFLSIYQTLRRKGGSFLRFLLSGQMDVFAFFGE